MYITFTNTRETVTFVSGGAIAKYQYPIGAGLSQKITIAEVGTATSIRLEYFSNGDAVKTVNIPTRPGMSIDLSIFSSLTQSIPEQYKPEFGTLNRSDTIIVEAFTGTTSNGFVRVGVSNVGSSMLGGYPGLYNNGNLWKGSTSADIATAVYSTTTLAKVQTYSMGFPDAVRVTATPDQHVVPSFNIKPTNSGSLPATPNAFSFGIWVMNVGNKDVRFQVYLNNSLYSETVLKPNTGGLMKYENVRVSTDANYVYFRVTGVAGTTMAVTYTRAQFNEGSVLRNWSPHTDEVGNSDNTKRYGFLTDYADGWKVACEEFMRIYSQQTGHPFQDRIYWGSAQPQTATADLVKYLKLNAGNTASISQGYRVNYSNPDTLANLSVNILNLDGSSVYGTIRYKRVPNLPPPNCRVCLSWLNSYGTYDTLYATEYNVVPTLTMQGTDGNKVQHYDVRVNVPVTENNERALEVLMRSQHVRCVIPNAPFLWSEAEIVGNALSFYAGGSTVKSMTIRFKAQIIGNW